MSVEANEKSLASDMEVVRERRPERLDLREYVGWMFISVIPGDIPNISGTARQGGGRRFRAAGGQDVPNGSRRKSIGRTPTAIR